MAKSKGRLEQPKGPKISVTPDERAELKRLREGQGLTQEQLADLMGVSNGTISNLENAKHPQVYASTWAEANRVLRATRPAAIDTAGDDRFKRVVGKYLQLDNAGSMAVEALIDALLGGNPKKPS